MAEKFFLFKVGDVSQGINVHNFKTERDRFKNMTYTTSGAFPDQFDI
jgi:hypothetical protein